MFPNRAAYAGQQVKEASPHLRAGFLCVLALALPQLRSRLFLIPIFSCIISLLATFVPMHDCLVVHFFLTLFPLSQPPNQAHLYTSLFFLYTNQCYHQHISNSVGPPLALYTLLHCYLASILWPPLHILVSWLTCLFIFYFLLLYFFVFLAISNEFWLPLRTDLKLLRARSHVKSLYKPNLACR